jgi:RNA polymerase sigma-70 factor (ECF subfamily)
MKAAELAIIQGEAEAAARRLARRLNLSPDARCDICQELLADLLARLRHFNPTRGTLGAFAGRIVANQACCIAKRILRERRVTACSLDQDEGCPVRPDQIAEDQGLCAMFGQPTDPCRAIERRLDLARCGTRLTAPEADLCKWLAEHPVAELVRLGLGSRSSIYRRIAELRALFAASGMASA